MELATDINSIASAYGMAIKSLQISATKGDSQVGQEAVNVSVPMNSYKTWNLNFTMTGSYDQFIAFLRDVESNVRLADVSSLTIKAPQKVVGGDALEYAVELHMYSLN